MRSFRIRGWLAMALAAGLAGWSVETARAEPSHGSFPYAWRGRGAFAPQQHLFGFYPTRWRQWPGQEVYSLTPVPAAEELPPMEDEETGAPKPPDDETMTLPETEPTPAEGSPELPPLELPGSTPGLPSPLRPMPTPEDPIPPLLPQPNQPRGDTPSFDPPSLEPSTSPPAESPSDTPESAPEVPPLEAPPSEAPSGATPTPTPEDPIPPLESPQGVDPLPTPSSPESTPPSSADAARGSGPILAAALPSASERGMPSRDARSAGSVKLGWVSTKGSPPEPTRFEPAREARQLSRPPVRPAQGAVRQATAIARAETPARKTGNSRENPLRESDPESGARRNPLRD